MRKLHLFTCIVLCLFKFDFAYSQQEQKAILFVSDKALFNDDKYKEVEKNRLSKNKEVTNRKHKALDFFGVCCGNTKDSLAILTDHAYYSLSLIGLAIECDKSGNITQAENYLKQSFDLWKSYAWKDNYDDIQVLTSWTQMLFLGYMDVAEECYKQGKIMEFLEKWQQALELLEISTKRNIDCNTDIVKSACIQYAQVLINIAEEYAKTEKYSEAANCEKHLLNIIEFLYDGKDNLAYISALSDLICYEDLIGNYKDAIIWGNKAFSIRDERVIKSKDYTRLLCNLAISENHLGNYKEAVLCAREAVQILKELFGDTHPDYAAALTLLLDCEINLGNYEEAVKISKLALEIYEKIPRHENPYSSQTLATLARCFFYTGNYIEAIRISEQALSIDKQENNINAYAISLHNHAIYLSVLGDKEKADSLCKVAITIISPNDSATYSSVLNTLAVCEANLGNYEEAVNIMEHVLKIQQSFFIENGIEYAKSLHNLAYYYSLMGNNKKALNLYTQAMNIKERSISHTNYYYFSSLLGIAECQSKTGKLEENIIRRCKRAIAEQEKTLGKKHPVLALSLESLTECFLLAGNRNDLSNYSHQTANILNNIITNYFRDLTSIERERFWNKYKDWYTTKLNKYTYFYPTDTLCMSAYNGALVSKGILLNSEIEMRKLIHESGDTIADYLYNEIRINNMMLQRLYEKPVAERLLNTDSLENIVKKLEKQLIKRSKIFGDYTKNLRIDWKDVMDKLGEKDIAIEFCSFPQSEDSTMYMALVLSKGMDCPKMIPLFEEKQIKKQKDKYSNHETARLVWEPLKEHLNKSRNVYFGPTGELYNIAIENIPHWNDDCLMSEKWNLFRLSSTRELAVIKDNSAIKKASVYGGISYNTETNVLINDTVEYGKQRKDFVGMYELADSINIRGGVNYLPSTKTEAEQVNKELKQKHIASSLRMGTLATEGSFKDLSGKRMNLLHIATHGFYWTKTKAKLMNKLSFLLHSNNPPRYIEDKAMNRSGLLFAGANNVLSGKKLPDGVNDGILTASEIAHLDLRGLDLVVLSACQTGLGEITGDGVFGLQRGFKKAGANSILMTLWEVADKATSLFMTEFYKAFMSGMSKQEAVTAAQKYVRDYESISEDNTITHPYQDPKFWAGFILLDAIH